MGKSCAINLRVAGSSPAGQLLILFHNVFQFSQKFHVDIKSSSQVPNQSFRAQTELLLLPTSEEAAPFQLHWFKSGKFSNIYRGSPLYC